MKLLFHARLRRVALQVFAMGLVVCFFGWCAHNARVNLERIGLNVDFAVLTGRAGFSISEVLPLPVPALSAANLFIAAAFLGGTFVSLNKRRELKTKGTLSFAGPRDRFFIWLWLVLPCVAFVVSRVFGQDHTAFKVLHFDPDQTYILSFAVGVLNTLKVSGLSIVCATVLGLLVGTLRLSQWGFAEWLGTAYVNAVRNVPLLLWLVLWYGVILQVFPTVQHGFAFFARTSAEAGEFPLHGIYLNNRGLFLPEPVLSSDPQAILGFTLSWNFPELVFGGRNLRGGIVLSPEFLALFLGLSLYSSSFVAEIYRSGIGAVDTGQREAAAALGLSRAQTLFKVTLPQALKVMIPPLTSQFLSLTKNSSLAVVVGYPDLVSVGGTILNQTGRAIEVILIWMSIYLLLSLFVSALMNIYDHQIRIPLR